jgi:hypothetical protein
MAHTPYEREFLDKLCKSRTMVMLLRVTINPKLQIRVLPEEVIEEYTHLYKSGEVLPPLVIWDDGAILWLVDGFLRFEAAKRAGIERLPMKVIRGTFTNAFLYACYSNLKNANRLTREDKRKVVIEMIKNPELDGWGDREIAQRCGVHHRMVRMIRDQICMPRSAPTGNLYLDDDPGATKNSVEVTPIKNRQKVTRKGKSYINESLKEEAANDDKVKEGNTCEKCPAAKIPLRKVKDSSHRCADCHKRDEAERAEKAEGANET